MAPQQPYDSYKNTLGPDTQCKAAALRAKGPHFTGVMKTATKMFPMKVLSREELSGCEGHWSSMVTTDKDDNQYSATVWSNRNRKYFINTYGTTKEGRTISRKRVQNDGNSVISKEVRCRQPQLVKQYFSFSDIVGRHNRYRQDTLNIEEKN
ncbi:hypothetical protein SARC_02524 [Sphaeroforma arctica JP610]|uniref:PiggyBac transposable element-derived protein domain-containing protein n=1 Tax=Sphaeroforma arctica JP610 TaxID=667725 RepID=A0A0L0G8U2_9EUKA|nr:hypothetical protein SARC_02524 [Sphaeroforma arctica JP610]KNC85301.1 hypothetical protein SARC_02524 [Sphaeroforma arctica JP610]|eukprot:XP_014159203.1 hypothetical protein SARC_02524 [Sphaeroforma arctica JP610]